METQKARSIFWPFRVLSRATTDTDEKVVVLSVLSAAVSSK